LRSWSPRDNHTTFGFQKPCSSKDSWHTGTTWVFDFTYFSRSQGSNFENVTLSYFIINWTRTLKSCMCTLEGHFIHTYQISAWSNVNCTHWHNWHDWQLVWPNKSIQ
jgi:hypothetical protein